MLQRTGKHVRSSMHKDLTIRQYPSTPIHNCTLENMHILESTAHEPSIQVPKMMPEQFCSNFAQLCRSCSEGPDSLACKFPFRMCIERAVPSLPLEPDIAWSRSRWPGAPGPLAGVAAPALRPSDTQMRPVTSRQLPLTTVTTVAAVRRPNWTRIMP